MSSASAPPMPEAARGGFTDAHVAVALNARIETSISERRIASLAAVLTAVALTATACGGNNSRSEVLRLRSANPVTSDLYVRIAGPAGAVNYVAQGLMRGAFSKAAVGPFVPPNLHGRQACSLEHTIDSVDAPKLQEWRGKKMTIAVYGTSSYAAAYCQGI